MKRRAVITGVGVVTPFGKGIAALKRGIDARRPNFSTLTNDNGFDDGCQIRHYGLNPEFIERVTTQSGIAEQMLLDAAKEALENAGWPDLSVKGAIIVGSGLGNIDKVEDGLLQGRLKGDKCFLGGFMGGLGFSLAKRFNVGGPVSVVSTACSSGNYAVARAAEWIFAGAAEMILVGGVDPRSLVVLSCFNRLGAADPEILRPFDERRNGTTLAEGAGVIVVEELGSALARGVTPYAELVGSGWSCDAYHPTAPEPEGIQARQCMERAIAMARKESGDVSVIFAHGTGTHANDLLESDCIADIFPQHQAVTAFKSLIGHSGAGSGVVTIAAAAQTIRSGEIPPTVNTGTIDPRCRAHVVHGDSAIFNGGAVVVNGFSFGGNNCSLVLQAIE